MFNFKEFNLRESFDTFKKTVVEYFDPFIQIANGSKIKAVAMLFVLWFFFLTPLWVSIGILLVVGPTFWQGILISVLLTIVLGIPQFILCILAGMVTFIIVDDIIMDFTFSETKKEEEHVPSE